ncbi:hypothetical protein KC573_01515 [candidate division WWE3 bacterium]|uniref:Galactose-1-phosphate uridylyltransferase n=1 Tax=candidate division WWE3 bacterium TaxID=2053526 RepID=A0A955RWQ5_UNCKA|nr:hypothetical protein [candidate division WWE3 bacterium]
MTVTDLPQKLSELSSSSREIFDRIFDCYTTESTMTIPESMVDWATKQFGSVDAVERQKLLILENKVLNRGVIFNEIRTKRPQTKGTPVNDEEILEMAEKPPFNEPEKLTPEDVFGRVRGEYCITASNVAKYDKWHGVIIFNEPHPLRWSEDQIVDYISVANQWFEKVHQQDSEALYPLFQWNCLWRAAASIPHGHAQVSVTEKTPYTEVDFMRASSLAYENEFGSNYFDDYFTLHQELGLAVEKSGLRIIFPLDTKKEREVMMFMNAFDETFAKILHNILVSYRDDLGVQSFNAAGYLKPFGGDLQWDHMPVVFRLIDRGPLDNKNADLGIMERFAEEVITNDPFHTASVLSATFS